MRRILIVLVIIISLLSSCSSGGMQGSPAATMLGAQVGGMVGGLAGNPHGRNYRGHMLGSIVGTVTGAAVGNALTTPRSSNDKYEEGYISSRDAKMNNINTRSKLSIRDIRFIDSNRNHVIESEEDCQIIFVVMNKGDYPIYDVTPIVEEVSGIKHLYISSSVIVESIPSGEGIKYTANIRTGRKMKTGEAVFRVYAVDGTGASSTVKEFVLPTQRVKR